MLGYRADIWPEDEATDDSPIDCAIREYFHVLLQLPAAAPDDELLESLASPLRQPRRRPPPPQLNDEAKAAEVEAALKELSMEDGAAEEEEEEEEDGESCGPNAEGSTETASPAASHHSHQRSQSEGHFSVDGASELVKLSSDAEQGESANPSRGEVIARLCGDEEDGHRCIVPIHDHICDQSFETMSELAVHQWEAHGMNEVLLP